VRVPFFSVSWWGTEGNPPPPPPGKTFVTLHTTTKMLAARRMYERLGYVPDADRTFPDGFVLLGYRKELSGSMS
jgi:hypothetical protein